MTPNRETQTKGQLKMLYFYQFATLWRLNVLLSSCLVPGDSHHTMAANAEHKQSHWGLWMQLFGKHAWADRKDNWTHTNILCEDAFSIWSAFNSHSHASSNFLSRRNELAIDSRNAVNPPRESNMGKKNMWANLISTLHPWFNCTVLCPWQQYRENRARSNKASYPRF